ncbi:MAG: L-threonylcarbamoyladenylate synthase [Vicinamibacterales bacterium]
MPPLDTRVLVVDPLDPAPAAVAEAAAVLRRGGLVVFPTETVYGLGANALDRTAVAGIFRAKERPASDPLIVHVPDAGGMAAVATHITAQAWALAARFWPGPLTLILPRRPEVPDEVTAGLGTVGVRVPAHPVARALLVAAGVPVAAPSANRFSRPSPTRAAHVLADLDGRVDVVLDAGPTEVGVESTVLDLTTTPPLVRRPGGIAVEAIRAIVPDVEVRAGVSGVEERQASPGQLLRHYAPASPMTLYVGDPDRAVDRLAADARQLVGAGLRVGVLAPGEDLARLAPLIAAQAAAGRIVTRPVGTRRDPAGAASALYEAIRAIDGAGVDRILATAPAAEGIGLAIRDRLTRAAEGRVVSA